MLSLILDFRYCPFILSYYCFLIYMFNHISIWYSGINVFLDYLKHELASEVAVSLQALLHIPSGTFPIIIPWFSFFLFFFHSCLRLTIEELDCPLKVTIMISVRNWPKHCKFLCNKNVIALFYSFPHVTQLYLGSCR